MIKLVLSVFALLVVAYGMREWRRSRVVGLSLIVVSAIGALFVWFPAVPDRIAIEFGVSRGADLILYCYSAISFLMILNLGLKQRELHQSITELARHIAMSNAGHPLDDDRK